MSHTDAILAAMDKRRRKLERHTNTPQALARRAEMEREFAALVPMTYPEPPPDESTPQPAGA